MGYDPRRRSGSRIRCAGRLRIAGPVDVESVAQYMVTAAGLSGTPPPRDIATGLGYQVRVVTRLPCGILCVLAAREILAVDCVDHRELERRIALPLATAVLDGLGYTDDSAPNLAKLLASYVARRLGSGTVARQS